MGYLYTSCFPPLSKELTEILWLNDKIHPGPVSCYVNDQISMFQKNEEVSHNCKKKKKNLSFSLFFHSLKPGSKASVLDWSNIPKSRIYCFSANYDQFRYTWYPHSSSV